MKTDLNIDFSKDPDGLVPAIIQDRYTREVLMLGYMNAAALEKTLATKKVTFYSRSKKRLWTKGEESGNYLHLIRLEQDCDRDSLLVEVAPQGPTCHTGSDTCWGHDNRNSLAFLGKLQEIVDGRYRTRERGSYVASLFELGTPKVAQKVGEEAVEVVIEALRDQPDLLLQESADLLFHLMILLRDRGLSLAEVVAVLEKRH